MYKGIEKNQNYTWLICAAQNMKNIVKKLKNGGKISNRYSGFLLNMQFILKISYLIYKPQKKIWGLSTLTLMLKGTLSMTKDRVLSYERIKEICFPNFLHNNYRKHLLFSVWYVTITIVK